MLFSLPKAALATLSSFRRYTSTEIKGFEITKGELIAGARAVCNLFELWQLNERDAAALLGCAFIAEFRMIQAGNLKMASSFLPIRIGLFLSIHRSLKIQYSDDTRAYRWINTPNRLFDNKSPLSEMLDRGKAGIEDVASFLMAAGQ